MVASISKQNIVNEGTVKAHVVYTISTTYPDGQTSVVQRRFNDFEWLQRSLENKYKDTLIPPIPEKDALSRFQQSVLQYRKREFNRFLARITSHPALSKDSSVALFLTAKDDELAHTIAAESALNNVQQTMQTFSFSSVLETVTKVSQKITNDVEEVDKWFSPQDEYLESLGAALSQTKKNSGACLATKTEAVATQLLVAEQLRSLADLENEHDKRLAKFLTLYQDFLAQKTLLDESLVKNQTYLFQDAVTDQFRLSEGTRRLLANRLDVLHNYQIAQQNLKAKVNANPSTEKLALEKQEAEQKEAAEKEKFEDITAKVKSQVIEYNTEKSTLMRWALRELVRENIEHGEQVIASWKELGVMLESVKK